MRVPKGRAKVFFLAAASAAPLMLCAAQASAQSTGSSVVTERRDAEALAELRPNTELITTGILTLGIPYIASVVVATGSPRNSDSYLYAPVAGPWLDLASREDCPANASCGNETAYQIALVADGILQGIGALEIASGFAFPVPHSRNSARSPHLQLAPSVARTSYGISALGTF